MSARRCIGLPIALAAILVIVGSCGSNSSEGGFTVEAGTTVTAGSGSKSAFIAAANRTCREAWPTIRENVRKYRPEGDRRLSRRRRTAEAIRIPLMAGIDFYIFDNIHSSRAPRGEAAEVEKIIGSLQEAVERGQRLEPLYSPAEVSTLFGEYNRRARAYGLNECLVNPGHVSP